MARRYTVLPGHSFDRGDGTTASGGDEIELEDDVAAAHAHRIDAIPEDVQTPAQRDELES